VDYSSSERTGRRRRRDHGASRAIGFGNDEAGNLASAGFERNRECAADAAHAAIEREFADEEAVVDFLSSEAA